MTDVILVKLEPDFGSHKFAPPFGILYLADSLEKRGFKVKLIHGSGNKANIASIISSLERENPIFIGFSAFTSSSLIPTKRASIEIKKRVKTPVIWGGLHSTMLPEQTLQNDFIDIIAIGEGEETIVELAECIKNDHLNQNQLKNIKGVGFKKNGKLHINEPRPFLKNLDDYSPAWHLLDIEKYLYAGKNFYTEIGSKLRGNRVSAMITSRGCPWQCGYCYNQAVNKRRFRFKSAQKVAEEIDYLKKFGVSTIIFEDDNFFASKNRALEIIRAMNIPWSSTIRADYVAKWGEEFVKELTENQCLELRIGAESGSQRTLDLIKKDLKIEQIKKTVELCSKYDIKTLLNFMIGIPGEHWTDVVETLSFMDELEKISAHVSIGSPAIYIPWPGTFLSRVAEEKGFHLPNTLEGWANTWAQRIKIAPYMDRRIKFIGYYKSIARKEFKDLPVPIFANWLKRIAKWRWKRRFFRYPLDYYIPAFFLRTLRRIGFKGVSRALYD